jgi:hypothetical protein
MGHKKKGRGKQADMKKKGYDGEKRFAPPVGGCKWNDPVKNGPETVFPTHVRKDELFFLVDQADQADHPVQAAAKEYNK